MNFYKDFLSEMLTNDVLSGSICIDIKLYLTIDSLLTTLIN